MKALSYRQNRIEDAVPLEAMAEAMKVKGKADPKATLNSVEQTALFHWSEGMGPGVVKVEREGHATETLSMPIKMGRQRSGGAVFIGIPAVLRIVPQDPESPGLTVAVTASGAYTVTEGAEATPQAVLPDSVDDTPMQQAARAWLRDGRIGKSSYALCVGTTGVTDSARAAPDFFDYPKDSADFARCVSFLNAVPEARQHLDKMNEMGPYWKGLNLFWNDLETIQAAGDHAWITEFIGKVEERVSQEKKVGRGLGPK